MQKIKDKLRNKEFWLAIVGMVILLLQSFNVRIPLMAINEVLAIFGAMLVCGGCILCGGNSDYPNKDEENLAT